MPRRADNPGSSQATETSFAIGERELDERTSVFSVEGDLDLSTAPQLKWKLLDALEAGHNRLIVDLSRTSFMDSTALGVLVGVNRSLAQDAVGRPAASALTRCPTSRVPPAARTGVPPVSPGSVRGCRS